MFSYHVELLQLDPQDLLSSSATGIVLYFTQRGARCRCEKVPSQHTAQSFLPSDRLIFQLEGGKEGGLVVGGPGREVGACWVPLQEANPSNGGAIPPCVSPPRVFVLWEVVPLVDVPPSRPLSEQKGEGISEPNAISTGGFTSSYPAPLPSADGVENEMAKTPAVGLTVSPPAVSSVGEIGRRVEGKETLLHPSNNVEEVRANQKEERVMDLAKPTVQDPPRTSMEGSLVDTTRADAASSRRSPSPYRPSSITHRDPHDEREGKEGGNPLRMGSVSTLNTAREGSLLNSVVNDEDGAGFASKFSEPHTENPSERKARGKSRHTSILVRSKDPVASERRSRVSSENASISTLHTSENDAPDDKEAALFPALTEQKAKYPNRDELEGGRPRGFINFYATSTQGRLPLAVAYRNLYTAPALSSLQDPEVQAFLAEPIAENPSNLYTQEGLTNSTKDFPFQWLDTSALASIRREQRGERHPQGSPEGEAGTTLLPRETTNTNPLVGGVGSTAGEDDRIHATPREVGEIHHHPIYANLTQEAMVYRYKADVFNATEEKPIRYSDIP
ncbi:unnamed protein product [Phytomonas sp. EM1]|nr:unnamed protein product [Phytomonas sp. EM1]|eukprot:CCW62839.1 unnamed protein product [Phytomonas sp. isolate EM1]